MRVFRSDVIALVGNNEIESGTARIHMELARELVVGYFTEACLESATRGSAVQCFVMGHGEGIGGERLASAVAKFNVHRPQLPPRVAAKMHIAHPQGCVGNPHVVDFAFAMDEVATILLKQRTAEESIELLVNHRISFAKPVSPGVDIVIVVMTLASKQESLWIIIGRFDSVPAHRLSPRLQWLGFEGGVWQ
jgi:hypothetical protein